jgi:hypothetical protein
MKNIILSLFVLISCNYFSQEAIKVNISDKEKVVLTNIYFDKEWKFLYLNVYDDNGKSTSHFSIYNPSDLKDSISFKSIRSQVFYYRVTKLTVQNIEDYLNGEYIFPLDDCKYRHDWGASDCYLSTGKEQNWCAKIKSMNIESNLQDNISQEGHIIFYDENSKFESTKYIRYFDENFEKDKTIVIVKLIVTPQNLHEWDYQFYRRNDLGTKYENLFSAYISRSFCNFYFFNYQTSKMMYFLAPQHSGIKNNAVYEIEGDPPIITQDNKYDFFKQFFKDYPDFTFRLLYENLDKTYYKGDVKGGFNSRAIEELAKQYNFNKAIDLSIFEYLIKSYTNNKYEAFSLKQRNRIMCEGD